MFWNCPNVCTAVLSGHLLYFRIQTWHHPRISFLPALGGGPPLCSQGTEAQLPLPWELCVGLHRLQCSQVFVQCPSEPALVSSLPLGARALRPVFSTYPRAGQEVGRGGRELPLHEGQAGFQETAGSVLGAPGTVLRVFSLQSEV